MTKNEIVPNDMGTDMERIQRWRWMLNQNVPVIGGWMHRRITSALTESALSGNWLAVQSLAVVFVYHQEADVRQKAGQTLRKINFATGIDAVWGIWAETRDPGLEKIARDYNRIASHPASARLLSALCVESLSTVTHGSADLIPPLIQALDDRDERIATLAREAILNLHNPASIDAVCGAWLDSRYAFLTEIIQEAGYVAQKPPAARVLSALKVNRLDVVMQGSSEMVAPLIKACEHPDPAIAERARACLVNLQKQAAVDAFCRIWSETRAPLLEKVLIQAAYRARGPVPVRLLAALKTGQMDIAERANREGLPVLLEATRDADGTIRQNARKALDRLQEPEAREALCERVIGMDDPLAKELALANGYTQVQPENRALFYFLTEQWAAYDALDFDQSMMRAIYEASPVELRRRISTRVQSAGRTEYLTILAGVDYRSRAEQVSPTEAALMIRILAENREYARLWQLAPELALPFSLEIIRILERSRWQPENEIDAPLFKELIQLANRPILLGGPELDRALPMAIQRSTIKLHGRVNEVAFSPEQPVLAIATSQRKVVLWDFQAARVEHVLQDFIHSVGKVAYTPTGALIVAERTSQQAICAVRVHDHGEAFHLTDHEGTVTVLEPVGENYLMTSGRDNHVALWDIREHKLLNEKTYAFWPRSAAISPDLQYAALLHDRLALVRLPELTIVPGYPFISPRADGFQHGVAQYAAFSPEGRYLLSGQYNGQVGLYYHTSITQRPKRAVVTQHSQPVRGIDFLPGHPVVITAGAEGQVRFIRWPEMTVQGMVYSPEGQLTSLRVSQQGAFMATGTNEASLVLWDLRVQDIPGLFSQPLATATHDQVSNVLALSEYRSLPEPVRNGLRFLRLLLQYRFRFDIQIDEAPIIQYGEFDILLDGA